MKYFLSISETAAAPHAAVTAANAAAGAICRHSIGIRRENVYTAALVPVNAVNLLVASAACGVNCGATRKSAGNRINPPPPTTASTQPAAVAAVISSPQSAISTAVTLSQL